MLPYIAYMDPMGNGMGQGIFHGRRSVVLDDLGDFERAGCFVGLVILVAICWYCLLFWCWCHANFIILEVPSNVRNRGHAPEGWRLVG